MRGTTVAEALEKAGREEEKEEEEEEKEEEEEEIG
jgi:hypothetical protein